MVPSNPHPRPHRQPSTPSLQRYLSLSSGLLISGEKYVVIFIFLFFSSCFKNFTFVFIFNSLRMVFEVCVCVLVFILLGFLWAFWICFWYLPLILENSGPFFFFFQIFLLPCPHFSFWDCNYVYVINIWYRATALKYFGLFFTLFSLCVSIWVISINFSLN